MRNTGHGTARHTVMAITAILSLSCIAPARASAHSIEPGSAAFTALHTSNETDNITVNITDLENGITGVIGKITINANPEHIWAAITDYDNQKHFVPKLIDSGLISDNGAEQIMFEKGRTGVLFFTKTVYIKMVIRGDYPKKLSFRQIEGDFKIYEGDWTIEKKADSNGCILTFRAMIKPNFFAPPMFVRKVQKQDLPMVLAAMKKRAESDVYDISLAATSRKKDTSPHIYRKKVAD